MIEKINKVNAALESMIEKLKINYERLEKKAIEAGKDLDDDASHSEYEALALIKKEAIINKVLYQYYSQKLRNIMEKAETSIADLITLNGKNDVFEVEVNSRDFMNNIDLEELCKGVRSFAVTDELISSFEMFSGSSAAPNEPTNENSNSSKIKYEDSEKNNYDIKPTEDEQVLAMAGSSAAPLSEELMKAGSSARTISEEEKRAGSDAAPLKEGTLSAGSSAAPITEELMKAGSSARTISEEEKHAGSDAEPLKEGTLSAGSSAAPISKELMKAGSNAKPKSKKLANAGSNVKAPSAEELKAGSSVAPISEELMKAGSNAEPLPEGFQTAGSDTKPKA